MRQIGFGECKGTFGELAQGMYKGQHYLVTLPIPLYSYARFEKNNTNTISAQKNKNKAKKACELLLRKYGLQDYGGILTIQSSIPLGKGMASSSADIVAALHAVSKSFNLNVNEEILSEIAIRIEPTDGVMYDEIVSYDYMNGILIKRLGNLPPMIIVGVDTGGFVNTIEFNHVKQGYSNSDEKRLEQVLDTITEAIYEKDFDKICYAVTESAVINQQFLSKPYFHEFLKVARKCQGGLVVAHSGTMMGIILNPCMESANRWNDYIYQLFSTRFHTKPFIFNLGADN